MKTALTIAGSDSSGGAGIQADLKTMIANGVYGMSAITALTAQNTTGVQGIFEVTPEFLEQEIDSVFTDIRPDAVKIGMVSSAGLIRSIAKKLHEHKAENIVVAPVMVATSGLDGHPVPCGSSSGTFSGWQNWGNHSISIDPDLFLLPAYGSEGVRWGHGRSGGIFPADL